MKLILAEYINSLKEDGELDKVIQDILRANGVEIFSRPERGRQYGVDIYAVGKDFTDDDKKKVFLITVKQGDLDRQNWDREVNSVRQSLDEIREVFVPNNLAPQHKKLPIKIVVAYNGLIKQSLQQNWKGYTSQHTNFDFALWEGDFLVEQFQHNLLNESGFSNKLRSAVRKTIIHLENRDYQFSDFVQVLDMLEEEFKTTKFKKTKLRVLKEMRLLVAVVIKYCEEVDNLLHAVKCSEKYVLRLWSMFTFGKAEKEFTKEVVEGFYLHSDTLEKYNAKFSFVVDVKDGLGRSVGDALAYGTVVYEQIGIWCETGLFHLQMYQFLVTGEGEKAQQAATLHRERATILASEVIRLVNNNQIFYTPRYDDHLIELHMLFMLLYMLGLKQQALDILFGLCKHIAEAHSFSRIFPAHRDLRTVAELETDTSVRAGYDYNSSYLFTVLLEWSLVLDSSSLYDSLKSIKDKLLKEITLLLWFPDKETENKVFTENANNDSGYALSGIELSVSMPEYKQLVEGEYEHNCFEKEFSFIKENYWAIGLIASRHFRTHIFPHYWRMFLRDDVQNA
ncbi:hypothetical protein [Sphingobacterium sp. UBA6320]|jgi:hypothetical protein|uniref:hypothetical protein n=1 Tax=Sphingobacterium sp. UBA6320 TaxID=1947510 RepID=UPI0025CE1541|nr:hypothetical protein [Sphingobacterium sp. UBA6320]